MYSLSLETDANGTGGLERRKQKIEKEGKPPHTTPHYPPVGNFRACADLMRSELITYFEGIRELRARIGSLVAWIALILKTPCQIWSVQNFGVGSLSSR